MPGKRTIGTRDGRSLPINFDVDQGRGTTRYAQGPDLSEKVTVPRCDRQEYRNDQVDDRRASVNRMILCGRARLLAVHAEMCGLECLGNRREVGVHTRDSFCVLLIRDDLDVAELNRTILAFELAQIEVDEQVFTDSNEVRVG